MMLIFFVGTIIRYILADFCKTISVPPDELRYYGIARSLFQGNGILIRNVFYNFQKITYSLILAPFFLIEDSELRISAISFINSAIMMSSVWLVWLIGEEIELKKNYRYGVVLICVIWPEMATSATFMSEILYWPLFLLYVYIWIVNQRKQNGWLAIILGVICYLTYMTKEIFLAMVLAYIGYEVCYPLLCGLIFEEKLRMRGMYCWNSVKLCTATTLSFVLCHVLAKVILFPGWGNSYNQMGITAILNPYNCFYFLYAFVYYVAIILVVGLIVPFFFTLGNFRDLNDKSKKLFSLILLFLVIVSATISYTISIREDLGQVAPRAHVRYFAPAILVVLLIFMKAFMASNKITMEKNQLKTLNWLVICTGWAAVVFKGVDRGSTVDQMSLNWYDVICDAYTALQLIDSHSVDFRVGSIAINLILVGLSLLFFFLWIKGKQQGGLTIFTAILVATCIISNYRSYQILYSDMSIAESKVKEVDLIDRYLEAQSDDIIILYITNDRGYSKDSKNIDTYLDCINQIYTVGFSEIKAMEMGQIIPTEQLVFTEALMHQNYEPIKKIDLIIVENELDFGKAEFCNTKTLEEISGESYTVYQNMDPFCLGLKIKDEAYWDRYKVIHFKGDAYDATSYVSSGISVRQEEGSWTEGTCMAVEMPTIQTSGTVHVEMDIVGTFNGVQNYTVNHNGMAIASGSLDGAGVITFDLDYTGNYISFELLSPDAQVVNEVYKDSLDTRQVAFQISQITIAEA